MANKFEVVLSAKLDSSSASDIQKQINELTQGKTIKISADNSGVNSLNQSLNEFNNSSKDAVSNGDSLNSAVGKFVEWQVIGDVIHGVKDAIVDMVSQVADLDASMTELSKVTDLTSDGLKSLEDDAFEVSSQIGSTGKDVIDATTIFAQAGYEAKDALDLSEQAITLKNVSEAGATAEGSAQTLISTLKGFKDEGLSATHIVDSLNEVSNKYAVSVNDLSTGIKKASAAMAASGNSYEEMLGLITAGTEVMQQPGKIANALSTISARLTSDNDEYIASITKGQGTVDDYTGELRSTTAILKDIAAVYPKLTSVQKQELIETVAGKTQRTALTSILTNFNTAINATETALHSEGSAAEENAKRMDSVEGKLNSLQSTWQEFSSKTFSSDTLKWFIDAGKYALEFVDKIGGLPTILMGISTVIANMSIPGIIKHINSLSNSFSVFMDNLKCLITLSKETKTNILDVGSEVLTTSEKMTLLTGGIQAATTIIGLAVTAWNAYSSAVDNAFQASQKEIDSASKERKKREDLITAFSTQTQNLQDENSYKVILGQTQKDLNNLYGEERLKIDESTTSREDAIKQMKTESDQELILAAAKLETTKRDKDFKDSIVDTASAISQKLIPQLVAISGGPIATGLNAFGKPIIDFFNKMSYGEQGMSDIADIKSIDNITKQDEALKKMIVSYEGITNKTKEQTTTLDALNKMRDENATKVQEEKEYNEKLEELQSNGIKLNSDQTESLKEYNEALSNSTPELSNLNDKMATQYNLSTSQKAALESFSQSQLSGASTTEEYDKALNNLSSSMDIVNQAMAEQSQTGSISQSTLTKLLETNSDYAEFLTYENGVVTINESAFKALTQAKLAEVEATIQAESTNIESKLNSERAAADAATTAYKKLADAKVTAAMASAASALGTGFSDNLQKKMNLGGTIESNAKSVADSASSQLQQTQSEYDAVQQRLQNVKNLISSLDSKSYATKTPGSGTPSSSQSKKSGSGSGSGSKSTQEAYKAEIDNLYAYKNAVNIAKNATAALQDTLSNTDSFTEQENIIHQLVNSTQNYINKENELRNAQVQQIYQNISALQKEGFAIRYNESSNELYIDNMQHLADYSGDTAKSIEKMIKKTEELNDSNVTNSTTIQKLTNDLKDYGDKLEEIATKKVEKFKDLFSEFQKTYLDQIQDQIDDIQHQMDNDTTIKALDKQISALENQNDELDSQKELEEKILAVEKDRQKIANLNKQRTIQVYRKNQGFVWEKDITAIEEAQKDLEDAQSALQDKIKKDQLQQLKDEKEALENSYQQRIDALKEFLDEQNYQIDKSNRTATETFDKLVSQLSKFGIANQENLSKAINWLNQYNDVLNKVQTTVSNIVTPTTSGDVMYSSEIQRRINQALATTLFDDTSSSIYPNSNMFTQLGSGSSTNINISNITLPNVQDINDFITALGDLPRLASTAATQRT